MKHPTHITFCCDQSDQQKEYHQALSDSVNQRLQSTVRDLQDKHARGVAEKDHPDRAPTGEPYKQARREAAQREATLLHQQRKVQQQQEMQKAQLQQRYEQKKREEEEDDYDNDDGIDGEDMHEVGANPQIKNGDNDGDDDDDDDDDDWLLDDMDDAAVLATLRARRLAELQAAAQEKASTEGKGHGQYRLIVQDEFLPEACQSSSEWVVVHFFHPEFQRCKIMDHHLEQIAQHHLTAKFLKIDANKTPFFVAKLKVQVLPTVLVFQNGKSVARLIGFEGISDKDDFETSRLQTWLAKTGAIKYEPPSAEIAEEMRRLGIQVPTTSSKPQSMWRGVTEREYNDSDEE